MEGAAARSLSRRTRALAGARAGRAHGSSARRSGGPCRAGRAGPNQVLHKNTTREGGFGVRAEVFLAPALETARGGRPRVRDELHKKRQWGWAGSEEARFPRTALEQRHAPIDAAGLPRGAFGAAQFGPPRQRLAGVVLVVTPFLVPGLVAALPPVLEVVHAGQLGRRRPALSVVEVLVIDFAKRQGEVARLAESLWQGADVGHVVAEVGLEVEHAVRVWAQPCQKGYARWSAVGQRRVRLREEDASPREAVNVRRPRAAHSLHAEVVDDEQQDVGAASQEGGVSAGHLLAEVDSCRTGSRDGP